MINFLKNELEKTYAVEINRRMRKMVIGWSLLVRENNFEQFQSIIENIENSPKFKLPWTIKEIKKAKLTSESYL